MNTPNTKSFWLSIGVALGLHAMLFVTWTNHDESAFTKSSETHNIEIRLTEKQPPQHDKNSYKPRPTVAAIDIRKSETKQQPVPKTKKTQQSTEQSRIEQKNIAQLKKENQRDSLALYKLLYSAINQQKHYPVSALRMKQQGTVRVSFRLFNNGNLDEVEVSQSSGYHSLDNAALLAVKRIQPFRPAIKYIASVRGFQLDIIFQL